MRPVLLCIALISCGDHEQPDPEPVTPTVQERYDEAAQRLVSQFTPGNRVVSFNPDGSQNDQGDSLIFSGVALGSLPCDLGNPIEDQLIAEIHASGGPLQRHPDVAGPASLDGALGLYFGAAWRMKNCAGSREKWLSALQEHASNDDGVTPKHFDYLRDKLADHAASTDRLRLLELEVAGWALAVVKTKAACFRIHLGYLALRTAEILGEPVRKNAFCSAANGSDIPLIDNWCGRGDLQAYISGFKYNEWVYRHQRCGNWETPDGNGKETPAIDFLLAVREAYQP